MPSISVDEGLAARLAERARRGGVTVAELAEEAIREYLDQPMPATGDVDPFAFVASGSNSEVRARDADGLLADEFGR